jgi:hypothetical protein
MRTTVIATVPSAVGLRPAAETAPVRDILTTAPPRPTGPRPATRPPQIQDAEHHQLESRRVMLRYIARLSSGLQT